jgi:hypothetical protein
MVDTKQIDMGMKVLGIIVLVAVILFVITWSGVVKCKSISPYWCDAYDAVMGGPRVLIVHGTSGLGDPSKLKTYLQDPRYIGVNAVDVLDVERVSLGNLKNYKLVIVEQARLLSVDQLLMFEDYVNKNGGRLVWVGDSGVEIPAGELRKYTDTNESSKDADNPWFRIKESDTEYKLINFDEFLGLKYVGNYCSKVKCVDSYFSVGVLEAEPTGNHPLIFGSSPSLNFKIKNGRDFAVVRQIADSSSSNTVLSLNFGGMIYTKDSNFSRLVPMISTSSIGLGERVAYYAYPPEWFYSDNNYMLYLKNLYFGMLGR